MNFVIIYILPVSACYLALCYFYVRLDVAACAEFTFDGLFLLDPIRADNLPSIAF
jgi:hypothetical protein